jgi:hypothetical protein
VEKFFDLISLNCCISDTRAKKVEGHFLEGIPRPTEEILQVTQGFVKALFCFCGNGSLVIGARATNLPEEWRGLVCDEGE